MWHMTRDTWHVTCWWGVNITSKFQLPSSYVLGKTLFWRLGGKGWLTERLNEWSTKVFVEQPWLHRVCWLSCCHLTRHDSFSRLLTPPVYSLVSQRPSALFWHLLNPLLALRIAEKSNYLTNKILLPYRIFFLTLACWPKKWVSSFAFPGSASPKQNFWTK